MGHVSISRLLYWGAAIGAVATSFAVVAAAQTAPGGRAPVSEIDLSRAVAEKDGKTGGRAVIDFENIEGAAANGGIALNDQYVKTYSVAFGAGASVHVCRDSSFAATAPVVSACAYPQAASGSRAALHDTRAGGRAMAIDFERPVAAVSMRINPTGGELDEIFVAQINGFNADGKRVATESVEFNWFQDAFTWPTSITLKTDGARLARITVELRREAANNQPVRFLIDDLALLYASETPLSPVASAIAQQDGPQRVKSQIVQSARDKDVQEQLNYYPAATRKRTVIDWEAVDAALAAQDDVGLAAVSYRGEGVVEAAQLPLLLPSSRADAGSVIVMGNRDSYNAVFSVGGRAHSIYGTRMLTVVKSAEGAPGVAEAVTFAGAEEALTASFSLYGASYSLTRHCIDESATNDVACHDRDALGAVAADLVVVVGEAGKDRP